jgi:hypothetical protein
VSRRPTPAVYRRRRILVLGIAVAVVALLVWGISSLFGGGDQPAGPTKHTEAAPTTQASPTATAGTLNVQLERSAKTCDPESIRITPAVDPGQFAGSSVKVQLAINTASGKPCTFEAEDADLLVKISQGDTVVYDSSLCQEPFLVEHVELSPEWATLVDTTWTGRPSGASCSSRMGYASSGTYVLKIGVLGGEPGKTRFVLAPKPKPKPSPSPSPSTTAGGEPSGEPKSGQSSPTP